MGCSSLNQTCFLFYFSSFGCIWKQSCAETQAQLCEHPEPWVMLSWTLGDAVLDPACSSGPPWCCQCLPGMGCRCCGLLGFILDLNGKPKGTKKSCPSWKNLCFRSKTLRLESCLISPQGGPRAQGGQVPTGHRLGTQPHHHPRQPMPHRAGVPL